MAHISTQAYFQGGGGANEPTPGKTKYKKEPAKQNDTKARGVLFRNYDLYDTKGVDGKAKQGPGTGLYQHMDEYKSVSDFRKKKRKARMKRRAMLLEVLCKMDNKDSNNITDPVNETVTPIPFAPAEPAPMGMLDGIYPQSDLDGKPITNLYYGKLETHNLADDGEEEDKDEEKSSKSK